MAVEYAKERPQSSDMQRIQAYCAIVTALAALGAVYNYVKVSAAEREKAAVEAISRIYPMDMQLNIHLSDKPRVRRCLRNDADGKVWDAVRKKNDPGERALLRSAAGILGNELEYYLVVRPKLDGYEEGKQVVAGWDGYLNHVCDQSPYFRRFILATKTIWSPELVKRVGERMTALGDNVPTDPTEFEKWRKNILDEPDGPE